MTSPAMRQKHEAPAPVRRGGLDELQIAGASYFVGLVVLVDVSAEPDLAFLAFLAFLWAFLLLVELDEVSDLALVSPDFVVSVVPEVWATAPKETRASAASAAAIVRIIVNS
jgi:hypothetical protein